MTKKAGLRKKMRTLLIAMIATIALAGFTKCSSSAPVKQQGYAKLATERTVEYDFPTTWKGIESAFSKLKITERDPEEVSALEMKRIEKRTLATDWIYSQSRDKYVEYKVNSLPRKQYLQTRIRYDLVADRVMGGVHITLNAEEEIEKLDESGTPLGYEAVDSEDTSRANEMLGIIEKAILAAPNT